MPHPDAKLFAPCAEAAALLLPHAFTAKDDGAHDLAHLARVWRNVLSIQAIEGGDLRLLIAATVLHDCVAIEKDSPLRGQASRLAATKATEILRTAGWPGPQIDQIAHAIEAHSFSARVTPESIEAKVLQDADRLDALGWVGVARCFYIAGRLGSQLYDPHDPGAANRPLDDARYALDHFETKLLRLSTGLQTATGRAIAQDRHATVLSVRDAVLSEVGA